ncbi:LANO_0C02718g1_1 [Lachancea nothofagi CBS 11611]|uniref:LANO_0C02718g1_1 n=1 Tax=Lachancea nothofagi CBS 11611 TaxID=1266666 RepID=A0A1G4J5T4_9SACH|nr:LANO_0C02718g1_1 [Lachancea nothofagi CBS 11611]
MKYLAAYLLLNAAGNSAPSAENVKTVLESVGIEIEEDKVSSLLSSLEGKSVEELIAQGNEKLAAVPASSGAAAPASGAAAGADAAEEDAPEEEKEESDDDMGFGLFD